MTLAAAVDVTGKWDVVAQASGGREYNLELILKEEGGKLTGTLGGPQGVIPLSDVQFAGDQLSFKFSVGEGTYEIKMTAGGKAMKGSYVSPTGATGPVEAKRPAPPAAAANIAGKWKLEAKSEAREHRVTLEFKEDAGKLSGWLTTEQGEVVQLSDIKLEGGDLTFKINVEPGPYELKFTVGEGSMKGTYKGPQNESGTCIASR